jgi:outer membrane protein
MSFSRVLGTGAVAFVLTLTPLAAQAESLRQALESAYANNPNIMSALLSVKMSAEDIALRKAGKLPSINLEGSTDASFAITPTPGMSSTDTSFRLGVSYRQNLFDNFQTEAQIEQARAFSELSKYALRNAEQNVLLSVATAYMNVLRDSQLIQLRAENVEFFQAQVTSAQDRLRLGEGTRIDVSQAEARLAQAVASHRAAIASLETSQASYERWVGHKARNLSADFRFGDLIPASVDTAIGQAEAQNPAILTARASIRAAQAGSEAAQAAFGPTLSLIGSLCGLGCFPDSLQPGMTGSVGLSLTVPLYAGGSLGASTRKANLEQIQSEVDALATRDQVRESVISAWASMQNAAAQITSAQSAVSSGQLVVEGLIQERDVGQRTTLDVLNAQAELTSAREGLITATSSRIVAAFSLVAATGRLSPPELGLNVEVKSADGYIATVEDVWQELRAVAD